MSQVIVLTFAVAVTSPAAESVSLELGLRRRAVEREERPAVSAIDSLYRLSLATIGICFAVCLALVAGVARREERRERSGPAHSEHRCAREGVRDEGEPHRAARAEGGRDRRDVCLAIGDDILDGAEGVRGDTPQSEGDEEQDEQKKQEEQATQEAMAELRRDYQQVF